jgi:hypothetical protein
MFRWVGISALMVFFLGTAAWLGRMSMMTSKASQPDLTATPTLCPQATPELFYVEPVTSPTNQRRQIIDVYLGNSEAITVTAESGVFAELCATNNCSVPIDLVPSVIHHLNVDGKVRVIDNGTGCIYGGYTLSTTRDRYGDALIIEQSGIPLFLPLVGSQDKVEE